MENPWPKNDAQHPHGRGQPKNWRTTTILLALGIILQTASVSGQRLSSRVVGGQNAELGDYPWQACLMYRNDSVCGGSLISSSWVVTAAHCVSHRNISIMYVLLGVVNVYETSPTRLLVRVKNKKIPTKYNGEGTSGDLALLELENPVNFNDNIRPIHLPDQNQEFAKETVCFLTGWGYTAEQVELTAPYTLQKVQLPLINSSDCEKMLPYPVYDDMICAGYPEGKKDGCLGDSGGPLACQSDGSWILVGVVSWGVGCARPQLPGVYTKISSFTTWIQDNSEVATVLESTINATTAKMTTPGVYTKISSITTWIQDHSEVATVSESKTNATTAKMTTLSHTLTQKPIEVSQTFTLSTVIDQGTTSAGRRRQISTSLLVVVIGLTKILEVILCL